MTRLKFNSKILRSAAVASVVLLCGLIPASLVAQNGPAQQDIASQNAQMQQAPPPPGPGDPNLPPPGYDQQQNGPPQNGQYPDDQMSNEQMPNDQSPNDQSPDQDPPGRVVRLQYMDGSVSIQPHGVDDWVAGSINRPLTTADNIWADKKSRAELSLGSSVMRIGSETSLTLTNVSDNVVQLQLHQGALNVHVRRIFDGETYEVDTPNQAFTIKKAGEYRFDVDPNADSTSVTVWKGEGEATGQGSPVRVKTGEQAKFTNGNSLTHQITQVTQLDEFDQWARSRDERQGESKSARYVGPGTVGAEDLDQYGTWKDEPEYGPVWTPTAVDPGWAPYRYGHWVWVAPWGWTWVDDAPWGFAPFHYGRWNYFGGYWGWIPGPYYARPYYAPALVGWFGGPRWGWGFGGFGVGFGFGFGFGGVGFGWCPLGFREPFHPWYGGSRGYFRNVNITNTRITNINNVTNNYYNHTGGTNTQNLANMNRPGGFTAVPKGTLTNSQPVNKNMANVPANALKSAPSLNQAGSLSKAGASPTRESMLGPNAGKAAPRAPQSSMSRPTVSRLTPPASSHNAMSRGAAPSAGAHAAQNTTANRGESTNRSATNGTGGHYVPRPPSAGGTTNSQMAVNHSVTRPTENSGAPARSNSNASNSGRGYNNNVPRPTGPVRPAPRDYASAANRGYSSRAYGGYGNYGPHSYGDYSRGGYNGSSAGHSAPSNGGGSHSGASHSAGGGHSSGGHGGGGHR